MGKNGKARGIFLFWAIILLLPALTGCGSSAQTTATLIQPTRDLDYEAKIEQQLAVINPDAVPIFHDATTAMDSGNYEKARELYEKVQEMAPGFSATYRRLGYLALDFNNVDRAIELSRKAMELEPNADNQVALARALLQKDIPKDSQEAFELATAAAKTQPDNEDTIMTWLLAAAAVENLEVARQADEQLLKLSPDNVVAHYYSGLLAATDGKWEKAESELLYSQQLGMPPEYVKSALDSGIARYAMLFRLSRWSIIAIAFWLLGLGILSLTGIYLSKATLRALNNTKTVVDTQVRPEERRVRSIYRAVITFLSLYYYISIPFITLLLFLVVGGAFYLFLYVGSIPIQLAVILVLMLVGSLFAIMRSVFSKARDVPPGRLLQRIDAPDLWALVEDVARKLAIRPVDSIYINPGVGIAVNENGGILRKIRGAGKRNLILGIGALPGLTQGQFSAILAHEYGHFSNRDTAGGDMAFQVYASLHQMAQRLVQNGAARIYNPVWLFLCGYERIFLNVTLGASRLQEVLSDRYAAIAYGGENFIQGLKNLIRQAITFSLLANYEIDDSLKTNRPVLNLYDLPMRADLTGELETQYEEAMKRVTSQYDSHPAPQERITWIERLHAPYNPMQDNPRPALSLFPNPEDLQREMTSQIIDDIKNMPS